jgi:tRNA(Arg) A34 adenosine deaminase TadA
MNDRDFMEIALAEAEKGAAMNEIPVGAVVVYMAMSFALHITCVRPGKMLRPMPRCLLLRKHAGFVIIGV